MDFKFFGHGASKCYVTPYIATGVATGKFGSKQSKRPMQKHAGRSSIDRKTVPQLSDPRYLLKCDVLSCEGVVKTVQTSPRRNKEARAVRDRSPSMLLYGALSLFRTSFPRCHALLCCLTSLLASPIAFDTVIKYLLKRYLFNKIPLKEVFISDKKRSLLALTRSVWNYRGIKWTASSMALNGMNTS